MSGDAEGGSGGGPVRLKVRLLGAAEVALDGQRLAAFDSARLQRLLTLLAVRRARQARSRIAFELWPDSDEGQARTNLRKLLHDLRKALPDTDEFIEIDNESVELRSTAGVDVDVWSFLDAVAADELEMAVARYGGDLLPACYDDWVLEERARLRDEAHRVLLRRAEDAVAAGGHRDAVHHAQRVLELEPTDEVAYRLQMEAYLALGDRTGALRTYHRCAEVLERELGVTPGDDLGTLYRRVRQDSTGVETEPVETTMPVVESPFVGREVELRRLDDAWRAVCAGAAHVALVTGEPGIGKSRLASELGRRVRAERHVVVTARAYEAAGRLPWGPVVDLLRSDAIRAGIDGLDPVRRVDLARLLPEILDESGGNEQVPVGDAAQRHRLFDAVSEALVGERPRLVVVDDLQWCDAETIEALGFVVRTRPTAPVLVVGTVRSEEVAAGHPLLELVGALRREGALTELPLDRFDEPTTAALAAQLGGAETGDPEQIARLWAETEGNPLFVVETLRAGAPSTDRRPVLTPTMRAVLQARLGQLPETAHLLAQVAAVIGRPFSFDLLAATTDVDEHELVDSLDELWRRRIIRDQGHTYDFSHDKLRAVALETLSPARRRLLHRTVAEAIATERGHDPDDTSAHLAAHYDQAGMVSQAVDAYRAAGSRAAAVSALDEAVAMFRRALALLDEIPPSPQRDALELDIRVALGSPLVALEGYGSSGAHRLYERALSLCRRLDRPVDPPILRGLGLARLQGCRFDDCSELGRALLDHESNDPVARTEGRYLLGVSAFWRGDLVGARRHLEDAIEGYDLSHRDEHLSLYAQDPLVICRVRLALVELWEGNAEAATELARSALDTAADIDHLMTRWYAITYAAIVAAESDDLDRLTGVLDEADRLWERLPMRYLMIVGEALRGWLGARRGLPDAIERIERSVERSRVEGETLHLTYCLLLLARAHGLAGDPSTGRGAVRDALAWSDATGQHYLVAELWRTDAELAHRAGDPEAAEVSIRHAIEVAESQGAGGLEARARGSEAALFPEGGGEGTPGER